MKFPRHRAISDYTGFLLRMVSTASFEGFTEIVAAYGLHPMHFGMMSIIDADEPVSQQELSRRTGIDPSTMVARMDALAEHGLVERVRSEDDRRNYEIRLSPQGRELLAELQKKAVEFGERFFAPLTAQERKQLHDLLAKLAAGLDEAEAKGE